MATDNPFAWMPFHELFNSLLPDFVLGFALFTALSYAVLARRFEHERAAVVMSAVIGIALACGLVWWEADHGLSIRHLGPIAVGILLLLIGVILFQGIRKAGGAWGGGLLALGIAMFLALLVQLPIPINSQVLHTALVILLIFGLVAALEHRHVQYRRVDMPVQRERRVVRDNVKEIDEGARVSDWLSKGFGKLRRRTGNLRDRSEGADDVIVQLNRMLPEQGWLTKRLADLRGRMHRIKEGHVARIEELRKHVRHLSPEAKRNVSRELSRRFKELKQDTRLDRLDAAVAENEKRIKEITQQARQATQQHDYPRLHQLFKQAEKLQQHNTRLFQIMDRTEKRLAALAQKAARDAAQVKDNE